MTMIKYRCINERCRKYNQILDEIIEVTYESVVVHTYRLWDEETEAYEYEDLESSETTDSEFQRAICSDCGREVEEIETFICKFCKKEIAIDSEYDDINALDLQIERSEQCNKCWSMGNNKESEEWMKKIIEYITTTQTK